jgi:hypothetical protein
LKLKGIKATFFVTGRKAVENAAVLKRIDAEGHEIGMSSYTNEKATTLTNDQLVAEYVWSAKAVFQATGKVPRYVKQVDSDARTKAVVKALGLIPIMPNRDSYDYLLKSNKSVKKLTADVKNWLMDPNDNGIISAHHDNLNLSSIALSSVLDLAMSSDFSMVKMSECLSFYRRPEPYSIRGKFHDLIAKSPAIPQIASISTTRPSSTSPGATIPSSLPTGTTTQTANESTTGTLTSELPSPTRIVPIRRNGSEMTRPQFTLIAIVASVLFLAIY